MFHRTSRVPWQFQSRLTVSRDNDQPVASHFALPRLLDITQGNPDMAHAAPPRSTDGSVNSMRSARFAPRKICISPKKGR